MADRNDGKQLGFLSGNGILLGVPVAYNNNIASNSIRVIFLVFFVEIGCTFLQDRILRMHWMDARALRRKDAFRGERPWGDTVCDPWISDRETVSKLRGCALWTF